MEGVYRLFPAQPIARCVELLMSRVVARVTKAEV